MAKASEVHGIEPDIPYAAAAARIVATRAEEVLEHSRGVLDVGDIERVHDMRVATRRLRAALEAFRPCFPRGEFKVALRDVKEIADALGERRDRDVTIAALEDFAQELTAPDRPGISSLVAAVRAEQADANNALAAFVSEARLQALHGRLAGLVAAVDGATEGPFRTASANGGDPA